MQIMLGFILSSQPFVIEFPHPLPPTHKKKTPQQHARDGIKFWNETLRNFSIVFLVCKYCILTIIYIFGQSTGTVYKK